MRKTRIILALAFGWSMNAELALAVPPAGTLHFFGVAYDEDPPKGSDADHYNYAPDNFAELFRAQSGALFTAVKVTNLKGKDATRKAVLKELRALDGRVAARDFVFIYWGTHGGTTKREWSANLPGGDPILGSEIKSALDRLPCPSLVAISTCGSGGFIRPTVNEVDLPKKVAAFAACQRQQSANNELDITLLEALAGFGDLNGDGVVTVREAVEYVPKRYRKIMRQEGGGNTDPVLGQGEEAELDRPLTKVTGRHAAVVYEGVWYGAVVLSQTEKTARVRYLGWDPGSPKGAYSFPDETVDKERIDFPGGQPPLEVEWDGTWYPAVAREAPKQGRYQVHYVGYPASDDETVPPKRVRFPFVETR